MIQVGYCRIVSDFVIEFCNCLAFLTMRVCCVDFYLFVFYFTFILKTPPIILIEPSFVEHFSSCLFIGRESRNATRLSDT